MRAVRPESGVAPSVQHPSQAWTEVTLVVPVDAFETVRALSEASGVSLNAFMAASLIARARQHAGRRGLDPELAEAARALEDDLAKVRAPVAPSDVPRTGDEH